MHEGHEIYARYAPLLYRFALRLCGNAADAEDLVADTFVRLWAAPGRLRHETVKAYLFTILRNLYLSRRVRARRETSLTDLEETVADVSDAPDERAETRIRVERLAFHVSELSLEDQRLLHMRGAEGLSYGEIAETLGLSTGAARVRVHRLRAQLTKSMRRELGE